jgi:hypothetical protein
MKGKRQGPSRHQPDRGLISMVCGSSSTEFRGLHKHLGAKRQECAAHWVARLPEQSGGVSAGEGGHFAGEPDFRPLYIRRQLGLRATLQRSLPSVSCTKRPNGHKARVSGWSPISDSSAIPSKLAPHRKVRVRKADYAWSLGL